MNHTKEPCPYCGEFPKPIIDLGMIKVFLDEDCDITVEIDLGCCGETRTYRTVNYCPMCGRKLEDV